MSVLVISSDLYIQYENVHIWPIQEGVLQHLCGLHLCSCLPHTGRHIPASLWTASVFMFAPHRKAHSSISVWLLSVFMFAPHRKAHSSISVHLLSVFMFAPHRKAHSSISVDLLSVFIFAPYRKAHSSFSVDYICVHVCPTQEGSFQHLCRLHLCSCLPHTGRRTPASL